MIYDKDVDVSYRENRDFSGVKPPSNTFDTTSLAPLSSAYKKGVTSSGNYLLVGEKSRLDFYKSGGKYILAACDTRNMENPLAEIAANDDRVMFKNAAPVNLTMKGSTENIAVGYDSVEETSYGLLATANITTGTSAKLTIRDHYYLAEKSDGAAFNMTRVASVEEISSETGIGFDFSMDASQSGSMEFFAPNNVFKSMSGSRSFQEMQLGSPFIMMRDATRGYTLSLSRYRPVITYENNSFTSYTLNASARSLLINYPAISGNRKYLALAAGGQVVYDLTIRACYEKDYDEASVNTYNTVFNLTDPRIVNTDIDEVYRVINEDNKVFLHEEEQDKLFNGNPTGEKYTSYGLPWRIYIESGEFGPYTYQAGFIGQQLPNAYN
ncbi:MAG: hypothetical protein J5736_01195, partial [Bacilli bacterium]|nr:hypothetical protein [Bacilli bacterium]